MRALRRCACLAAVATLLAAGCGGGHQQQRIVPGAGPTGKAVDPLAYRPELDADLTRRAAAGFAHVLYAKSPGGVFASAARTARWRPQIEAATKGSGVDPDTLEAIVFLESAGRQDVIAGGDPAAATGLTQIVASTATALLGMHVDLAASRRLTRAIRTAQRRHRPRRAARLRARRRRADDRFVPAKALAATVRYLRLARRRFGRDDLAVVSYHMGIGNLRGVLAAYGDSGPSYARLYFDATPLRHASAFALLSRFGDDSATYYWRVLAAREIMRLYRSDRARLARVAALQTARASAEEVLHPPGSTTVGRLVPFPRNLRRFGLTVPVGSGRPALRPEAVALAAYLGTGVRVISHSRRPLTICCFETTGYGFDVLRRYSGPRQAHAFQFMLDRLLALNMIAWAREGAVIHIAVSSDAGRLRPILRQ